jgi:hypothetical protein
MTKSPFVSKLKKKTNEKMQGKLQQKNEASKKTH